VLPSAGSLAQPNVIVPLQERENEISENDEKKRKKKKKKSAKTYKTSSPVAEIPLVTLTPVGLTLPTFIVLGGLASGTQGSSIFSNLEKLAKKIKKEFFSPISKSF
jgi:hypothetical protein